MPKKYKKKYEGKILKTLVSWNVNGIRACEKKGFVDFVNTYSPDVLCLQEIKAEKEQFPDTIIRLEDYHLYINSAQKKGYSGVCVMTKEEPLNVIDKIGVKKFDDEGRTLILEFKTYVLFNCYFPNGQRDHNRVPFKLEFYNEILKLYKKYTKAGKKVIITGDFNTAHTPIDLANPKTNKKTTGFLENEREWIDKYLNAGMLDALRIKEPELEGQYTWWTYRGDCRARNVGWRIDYFMISETLKSKFKSFRTLQDIMGSDHCPIELTLK